MIDTGSITQSLGWMILGHMVCKRNGSSVTQSWWQLPHSEHTVTYSQQKSPKCSTRVQSQKLQDYLFVSKASLFQFSRVQLFVTPWTAARQASLSIPNFWSLLKFMFIESMMPSNHLILCCLFLLLPLIFPRIRVFFNESFPRQTIQYHSNPSLCSKH